MDSILAIIFQNAEKTPDRLCVADGNICLTCGQYRRRIAGAAAALRDQGLGRGGRVVIRCTQDTDFLTSVHAVQLAGGVAVPVEKGCAQARVDAISSVAKASFVLDPHELSGLSSDEVFPLPKPEQPSLILFTTGTTGASKGVRLRHAADVAAAENIFCGTKMRPGNIEVCPLPLNHSAGLRRYFSDMLAGGTFVILDGLVVVRRFFDALDTYGATSVAASPAVLPLLFRLTGDRLGQYADRLEFMSFGTAPFPDADKTKLKALLPRTRIYDLFGSTEAGVSCVSEITGPEAAPKCIGRPTHNASLRILNENGCDKSATAEDPGLLAWGGSMCMDGYWGEPELTARTLVDGYIHTSDLGYRDGTGRVFLLGRADDVINRGGHKIAPGEVEDAARGFPGVRECVCVPAADELAGQALSLFYEGQERDPVQFRDYLRSKLEPYKVPSVITHLDALPRTYNGKLDRKALRQ
jgi:long-chain acyl-CoA synthetase